MNRFLRSCFDNFARPLIFYGLAIVLANLALLTNNGLLESMAGILLLVAVAGIFGSMIYLVVKKRWQELTVTALIFGLTVFLVYLLAPVLSRRLQLQPEKPAADLSMAADTIINKPVAETTAALTKQPKLAMDFDLYRYGQPGTYKYDCWMNKIDSGVVYLKVFEVSNQTPLSQASLPAKTSLVVYNPLDSIIKFSLPAGFTIYEGDAGKPYAARFELWFIPDKGGPEVKLLSKDYTIEGGRR